MDFVFNELSLRAIPKNDNQAGHWLRTIFDCLIEISRRRNCSVYFISHLSFNEILISQSFPFSYWIGKQEDKDFLRRVLSIISKKPLVSPPPGYFYKGIGVFGLGVAFENGHATVSYPFKRAENLIKIKKSNSNMTVTVKSISGIDHVNLYFPVRYFDHHLKHDNRRHNKNDGQSTLFYDIPREQKKVELLLASAVGARPGGKLYNYDRSKKMFIEFQQHMYNRYHGYHIVDSSRVPNRIKILVNKT